MDMVWSMPGVNTAPYGETQRQGDMTAGSQTDDSLSSNNNTLLLSFNYIIRSWIRTTYWKNKHPDSVVLQSTGITCLLVDIV